MLVPAATPAEIVDKLSRDMRTVRDSPDMQSAFLNVPGAAWRNRQR